MKKRWVFTAIGLTGLGAAILAAPPAVVAVAGANGVTVEQADWCPTGVCLHGVTAPGLHELKAAHVAIDWDRSVRLVDVTVSGRGAAPTAIGGSSGSGWIGWVRRVTVEALTLEGTPLPALSGEVYPERHLVGKDVTVEGDVADARLDTPYGPVHARVEPCGQSAVPAGTAGPCLTVDADADSLLLPAPLLGAPLAVPKVRANGVYNDGRWTGTVGALAVTARATVDVASTTATFTLSAVPIADVYALLQGVVPEASRAHILGSVDGAFALTLHADGGVSVAVTDPALTAFHVDGLVSDDVRDSFTYVTADASGAPSSRTAGPSLPGWLPLGRIGPVLPAAIVAAEDSTFYTHPGYDLQSMVDAANENDERGVVHRGGSTLTQQLAKNLYLDGTRTYVRKLRELLYAVNLEGRLGKPGVLETYLNVVEFGPGIYGCEAAADRYFLKSPSGLLPEEAAWLASVLPSPTAAWAQQYQRGRPNMARVRAILDNMITLPEADREAAKGREVHFVR